jgi:GNAT superfamily N-acetyltransferase
MGLIIREAILETDWREGIWPIFQEVVRSGDSFAFAPDTTEQRAREYWMLPLPAAVFVAIDEVSGKIIGSSYVRPNQPGLGGHVANAAFMVAPSAAGHGAGRALGEHAIVYARATGYSAMQFNFVVATNERAVTLWKNLGFAVIGTIPDAFQHQALGRKVDAFIMHRFL